VSTYGTVQFTAGWSPQKFGSHDVPIAEIKWRLLPDANIATDFEACPIDTVTCSFHVYGISGTYSRVPMSTADGSFPRRQKGLRVIPPATSPPAEDGAHPACLPTLYLKRLTKRARRERERRERVARALKHVPVKAGAGVERCGCRSW
jgi:hypothetical protein